MGFLNKIYCEVVNGSNNIFTKRFSIKEEKDENGMVLINGKHKVKIINCTQVNEVTIGKSASKKLAGAATLGVLTGGFGAVVGAIAVGNNKKKTTKYNKLIAVDEDGYTHEVILKHVPFQSFQINTLIG